MILTIWRHGAAGSAVSDELRELTPGGTDDVGYGCRQFHDLCHARGISHPELVLHSPWVRTTQTAEIIDSAFTHALLRPLPALAPGGNVAGVDRALEDLEAAPSPVGHVVLVGHQPLVSRLVDHYLGARDEVPALSPGGLVTLALDAPARGCARLQFWALPPEFEAGP